jgi:outer membrane immunogenic protein
MKKLMLGSVALAAMVAGPAVAADMPVKAPPPPPVPAFSWTGCYVGGHIGAGWGHANVTDPNTNVLGPGMGYFAPTGGAIGIDQSARLLGGGQLGCDYQYATNWVIGLAGDFSWTNLSGDSTDPFAFAGGDPFFGGKAGTPATLHDKTEWLATVTGRVGYARDRWMLYGKGGVAWEHSRDSIQNLTAWGTPGSLCFSGAAFTACNPSGTDTQVGWTIGVGLTYAFANNWSAGIEYDHYGFGTHSLTLTDPNIPAISSGPSASIQVSQRIDAVKFILDYHFGWLAPH